MNVLKSILLAGSALVACVAVAQAADLPTKKAAPAAAKPNCYATFWTWLDSTAADCPLSAYGFTVYGTVDIGGGYASSAAPFNKDYPNGIQELISKQSKGAAWQLVPNGLSQSNIGIKMKEQIAPNWFLVGDVNAGFDPYSLQFSSGPASLLDNNGVAQVNQSSNGDSSRAYNLINSRAYVGVSNTTFGTLTVGRQYTFANENSATYDPFGGSYAFSLIGTSGTAWGGNGVTETARYNTSVEYKVAYNGFRAGAMTMFGGYGNGNAAKDAVEFDIGGDWNGLSADATYQHADSAVNLGANTTGAPYAALKATLANVDGFTVSAKYKWQALTVYGGYEHTQLTNPSDVSTTALGAFGYFNGGVQAQIQKSAYLNDKVIQLLYIGAKYGIRPDLDAAVGFYHEWQNNYAIPLTNCGPNTAAVYTGSPYSPQGAASPTCAGTQDVVSGMLDYRPVKRLDIYGGVMYSVVAGGFANGYFKSVNIAPTAGLRFSF